MKKDSETTMKNIKEKLRKISERGRSIWMT